ncbi:phosphoribosylaminoimidazole carboxylase ATPase subunit [Anoxybacillus sp. BCO1]|nr:phosphoribosylaminoimidazole carboxylase ATPase subunit [Anoxybacillus sp. BCO1]
MISLNKTIVPGQTIGIIGGGQLGRMMAIAAKEMGFLWQYSTLPHNLRVLK